MNSSIGIPSMVGGRLTRFCLPFMKRVMYSNFRRILFSFSWAVSFRLDLDINCFVFWLITNYQDLSYPIIKLVRLFKPFHLAQRAVDSRPDFFYKTNSISINPKKSSCSDRIPKKYILLQNRQTFWCELFILLARIKTRQCSTIINNIKGTKNVSISNSNISWI